MSNLAVRGLISSFYRTLNSAPGNVWWNRIGRPYSSDQAAEIYPFLGAVPPMRKWNNERQNAKLPEYKIIVHNDTFESSIEVSVDDIRRDKTGQHMERINNLAARAGWQHWHKLLSDLVIAGGGTTYGPAYDGQAYFATAHSVGKSGTISNDLSHGSNPTVGLNVGTANAPTAVEAAQAILGVINHMRGYSDESGEPVNEEANDFVVMYPPNLAAAFDSAVKDVQILGASFGINPLVARSLQLQGVTNVRLTNAAAGGSANDDDVFYVFRADGGITPFITQEEFGPKMDALGPDSEFAIQTNQCRFGAKASRGVGYGEFFYAARATLS